MTTFHGGGGFLSLITNKHEKRFYNIRLGSIIVNEITKSREPPKHKGDI